jgi:outer membrane protein TolC
LVLAASLWVTAVARAQPAPPGTSERAADAAPPAADTRPLTLTDAVRAGVERTPEVAAISAAVAAARARAPIERELMPPMVDVQAWQWPLDTANPADVQWMIGVEQAFPGRGKRDALVARMEAEAGLMANEIRETQRTAAREVARAYVDLRVAREELVTVDSSRTLVRQSIDASEARYAAGRSSQQDTLAGIVELSRLAQEEVMARERERMARSTLNVLLGRAPDDPIGPLEEASAERAAPRLADVETRLQERHPAMTAIDRTRDVAAADLVVARQASGPDYIVGAGYMTMPSMRDAVQFKVGVTWPGAPWTKKRVQRETAAAEAAAAAVDARRAAVVQRIRLMAQESIVKADSATERAAVLQSTILPPAEHVLEVARVAYIADRAEFMPVIDAQRVLLNARLEIRRALADRDRALAELAVLLGEFDGPGEP